MADSIGPGYLFPALSQAPVPHSNVAASTATALPHQPASVNSKLCTKCHKASPAFRQFSFADGHAQLPEDNNMVKYSIAGNDCRLRLYDEEDSAHPALLERDFHSFHRNVPGLRRAGVDANAIRQHYYPDGGWGWIICSVAFLAHILTTGFQLSYGLLSFYAVQHLGKHVASETVLLGAISWAVSMFVSPIIIAICRRKSTRLTAVLGGLVYALGILFASFATLIHQVAFSYGIVVGVGAAMVRESSALMLGLYFKKRRQFVEMISMSGEGVGIALFSVILKEGVGKMGWRLGLQIVAVLVASNFFMGLLYRSASLYHPQRRAILHLKNQRKKVKEKKTHIRIPKPPFIDFAPFKSSTVRMFVTCSSIASLGAYTPIFFLSLQGSREGYDVQDLVLLQTFLGLAIAFGIVISGSIINRNFSISFRKFNVSRQCVCQINVILIAISMLIISGVTGYRNLCLLSWSYGLGLGGYRYTLKMLALERIRPKYFTKAWGFIRAADGITIIVGVPLTALLNDSSHQYGRAGYYICSAAMAISAILMCFIEYPTGSGGSAHTPFKYSTNGSIMSHCTIPTSDFGDMLNRSFSTSLCNNWHNNSHSQYTTIMNTCLSSHHHQPHYMAAMHRCPASTAYTASANVAAAAAANAVSAGVHNPNQIANKTHGSLHKSLSFAFQYPTWYNVTQQPNEAFAAAAPCFFQNQMKCDIPQHCAQILSNQHQFIYPSRSRSVPEGLEHVSTQHHGCHSRTSMHRQHTRVRPIHLVEQITTSV